MSFFSKTIKPRKICYNICGIKFTRPTQNIGVYDIHELIYHLIDVSKLPPAQGVLKNFQEAELQMLLEVDVVCKKSGLKYWLDFGALLGAIRHKGFIPWDDDIDLGMMRRDYERFISVFNRQTTDKNLFATLYSHPSGQGNIIKVYHKLIPDLFIDVFPYDFYYKKLSLDEKQELNRKIRKVQKKYKKRAPKDSSSLADFHQRFQTLRDELILEGKKPESGAYPAMFWGMEFLHAWPCCVFDYESYFPLGEVEFCGHKFSAPADPDLVLTTVYHDYMTLPKKLHYHNNLDKLPVETIQLIKKYARGEKL